MMLLAVSLTLCCPLLDATPSGMLLHSKSEYLMYILSQRRGHFNTECADIITVMPYFPVETDVVLSMHNQCQHRFRELHQNHARQEHPPHIGKHREFEADAKRGLLILDLDETVLDQTSYGQSSDFIESQHPSFWDTINHPAHGLMLSINRLYSADMIWITIFRRFLMNLIAFTQNNNHNVTWDVMLYSNCGPHLGIFHAVTVEMYYNFVLAQTETLNEFFYFRYVILRRSHAASRDNHKSLRKVWKVITSCNPSKTYKNIVIIDDAGDRVWSPDIPKQIGQSNVRISCFQPHKFMFTPTSGRPQRWMMNGVQFQRVWRTRNQDHTLLNVITLLQWVARPGNVRKDEMSSRLSLKWIQF